MESTMSWSTFAKWIEFLVIESSILKFKTSTWPNHRVSVWTHTKLKSLRDQSFQVAMSRALPKLTRDLQLALRSRHQLIKAQRRRRVHRTTMMRTKVGSLKEIRDLTSKWYPMTREDRRIPIKDRSNSLTLRFKGTTCTELRIMVVCMRNRSIQAAAASATPRTCCQDLITSSNCRSSIRLSSITSSNMLMAIKPTLHRAVQVSEWRTQLAITSRSQLFKRKIGHLQLGTKATSLFLMVVSTLRQTSSLLSSDKKLNFFLQVKTSSLGSSIQRAVQSHSRKQKDFITNRYADKQALTIWTSSTASKANTILILDLLGLHYNRSRRQSGFSRLAEVTRTSLTTSLQTTSNRLTTVKKQIAWVAVQQWRNKRKPLAKAIWTIVPICQWS